MLDSNGRILGMSALHQKVLLAVSTERGSAAMRSLGQTLKSIERISSNFSARVENDLRTAVQHLTDPRLIEVVGVEVSVVKPGGALIRLRWRDLSTGEELSTQLGGEEPEESVLAGDEDDDPIPYDHYDYAWVAKDLTAPWSERDGMMSVYAFDKWWGLGGWNPGTFSGGVDTTNEIYSATDLTDWALELSHDGSPPTSGAGARWKRRHWFGCFLHTHNDVEYIYVLGGDHESYLESDFAGSGGYQSDIWRSADGLIWERVMESGDAPWGARMLQVWGSSTGTLWMFGGQDGLLSENPTVRYDDLWTSTDGGATWSLVAMTNKPSARGIINKLPEWNGRMWLVSGGTYETLDVPTRTYCREVWSFDPTNTAAGWTQHATPPWLGAGYCSVEVFNDRLFVLGGYSYGLNTRSIWSTADGESWLQHDRGPWPRSHADGTATFGTQLGHILGNGSIGATSYSYALEATPVYDAVELPTPVAAWDMADAVLSGSNIVSVPDSSGNGHDLVPTVLGDATINSSDSDYGGAPSANSNGALFLHSTDAVTLTTFDLCWVAKALPTDGLFYHVYSLSTGPTRYMYVAFNRTGEAQDKTQVSADIFRDGVSTTGFQSGVVDIEDIAHVYWLHYDGTAAGSFLSIDGAQVFPDDNVFAGNAGTSVWTSLLYFFSDNTGAGDRACSMAAARIYPLLTASERAQVDRDLRALYFT